MLFSNRRRQYPKLSLDSLATRASTRPTRWVLRGLSGEHGLAYHWRISTIADRTPDEHAMVLTQLLDLEGLDLRTAVTAMAICSSAPDGDDPVAAHGQTLVLRTRSHRDRTRHEVGYADLGTTILAKWARTASPTRWVPSICTRALDHRRHGQPRRSLTSLARRASTSAAPSRRGSNLARALYSHASALRSVELVRTALGDWTLHR